MVKLKGTKLVEVPYFSEQLEDTSKSILIIGERWGGVEGISETIKELNFNNVTTTDILPVEEGAWLSVNTDWKHIQSDFAEFDEQSKFDYIISISVFEHFGFWFAGDRMASGLVQNDICYWNHDIRGILKASALLRDRDSKLIITLPAGPYMNYEESGEPFLRYYDRQRQGLIRKELERNGYKTVNERYFISNDFINWDETSEKINNPEYYPYYNIYSPNVIWGLTIQLK